MNEQTFKRISTWGRALGIFMMITGGISALFGLTFFVIGSIPGLITAYLGYLVYKTGKSAKSFIQKQDEESLNTLLEGYAKYLLVNGILLIVSLAFILISFMLGGFALFALFM